MAIDMMEILQSEQAACITAAARAHAQQMDMQQKVFVRLESSVDLVEASAAKELSKAGLSTDLASIRPPALPAVTP